MRADDAATRFASTVLVVDDDLAVRLIVRRILEGGGHAVSLAPSGQAALTTLTDTPDTVGLVLSDVRMPGMTGLDLAREVRRSWPDLPILLMSAYEPPELLSSHAELVGLPMLRKPFSNDVLLGMVRAMMPVAGAGQRSR